MRTAQSEQHLATPSLKVGDLVTSDVVPLRWVGVVAHVFESGLVRMDVLGCPDQRFDRRCWLRPLTGDEAIAMAEALLLSKWHRNSEYADSIWLTSLEPGGVMLCAWDDGAWSLTDEDDEGTERTISEACGPSLYDAKAAASRALLRWMCLGGEESGPATRCPICLSSPPYHHKMDCPHSGPVGGGND